MPYEVGVYVRLVMLESLRPILETALDAVVVMRRDGTVAGWNRNAERTFQWTEAEALGRLMSDLIIPVQHRDAHSRGLERYLASGEARVLNQRIEISAIDKQGREFPIELSITTAAAGSEPVFVGFLRDISKRRESEAKLAKQARDAQLLFDVARLAADTGSVDDALRACLEAICNVTGWPVGHALVRKGGSHSEFVSAGVWNEQNEGDAGLLRGATENTVFTPGLGLPGMVLEKGEPLWVSDIDSDANFLRKGLGFKSAFAFPVQSEGRIIAVLEFFTRDQMEPDPELLLTVRTLGEQVGRVLERKRTEARQELLISELNHRVKNTLAMVQSVASQTFRGDAAQPSARHAFQSRLQALASAHDVLSEQSWDSASISEVISRAAVGCGVDKARFSASGPEMLVPPKKALSLAMALHELCTNAVKYGALSNDCGTVSISWRIEDSGEARQFLLEWNEQGGPRVEPPKTTGFGTRMIERALASDLEGTVETEYLPEGLRFRVRASSD